MNIKFKRITISNFMSFGKNVTIDLESTGFTLVNGVNYNIDDNAKSNGSGKSSIWESIAWVLTGETIRGSKNITNIFGEDGALVDLTFSVDDKDYEIIRTKDHSKYKSSLKIFIDGEDISGKGIRDTERILNELLPEMTSQMIGSVIILGQGLPQRFTNNSPSKRKEILEKLSKSDFMLEDLKARISSRKNSISDKIREIEDTILKLDTEKNVILNEIEKTQVKIESLSSSEELVLRINTNKDLLLAEKSRLCGIESEIELLSNELSNKTSEKESCLEVKHEKFAEIENKFSNINNINLEISSIQGELRAMSSELHKISSITDVCPTCGQKLPNVTKIDTTDLEESIKNSKEVLNNKNLELKELEKSKQDALNTCMSEINDTYSEIMSEIDTISQKLNTIKDSQVESENTIRKIESLINQDELSLQNLSHLKSSLEESLIDANARVNEIDSLLLYNNKERDIMHERLDIILKMNTIITRDFRGYLLSNVIEFIDSKSREYCKDVFDNDRLSFKLDGNNISISYDDKEYELLSGGERQKIDLIVQFAIRDMLCVYQNFSSNILVVDELFDNLDELGCEKILNLITSKLSDVESVYIITHHSDIVLPIDNEITIVKGEDKISYVL